MLKLGDKVNYHSMVGGPVTSEGHVIEVIKLQPNNFGCDVAWISGKSGCVALAALSNERHPMKPWEPRLTSSQKRYRDYLESEYSGSFAEYLGVSTECRHVSCGYQYVNHDLRIEGEPRRRKKDAKAAYKTKIQERSKQLQERSHATQ